MKALSIGSAKSEISWHSVFPLSRSLRILGAYLSSRSPEIYGMFRWARNSAKSGPAMFMAICRSTAAGHGWREERLCCPPLAKWLRHGRASFLCRSFPNDAAAPQVKPARPGPARSDRRSDYGDSQHRPGDGGQIQRPAGGNRTAIRRQTRRSGPIAGLTLSIVTSGRSRHRAWRSRTCAQNIDRQAARHGRGSEW